MQSAIAKIIEAKNSISISFKLHKIIMEIIIDIIENKLVDFKLVSYLIVSFRVSIPSSKTHKSFKLFF